MEKIIKLVEMYNMEIILGLGLSIVLLFLLHIISVIKMNKKIEKYKERIDKTNSASLEREIISLSNYTNDIKNNLNIVDEKIHILEEVVKSSISKIGFIRYNAFEASGSRLSYSIALLDNKYNGFLLTSIYSNGDSISYAKPVEKGESNIPLSAEELIAIDRAINGVDK